MANSYKITLSTPSKSTIAVVYDKEPIARRIACMFRKEYKQRGITGIVSVWYGSTHIASYSITSEESNDSTA